jgi:LmbE family N-acetylglucosaminyl deacetylase
MLGLSLPVPAERPLRVLAVGAHPDDIEIGAGGTLLRLAENPLQVRYVVMTGTPVRHEEARAASAAFLENAELAVDLHDLPEGRLPVHWAQVKEILEGVAGNYTPDVILAPSSADAHQDHRTVAEIVPTVFRDSLYLSYEIPKWDGDMWRSSVYIALSAETAHRKVELLTKHFPSQVDRDWWDDETFLGLARLRGVECRAPYAEAFGCTKVVLALA